MKWYNKNKSETFEFILVFADNSNDKLLAYLKKKKINFPAIKSSAKDLVKDFRTRKSSPWLIIIDEKGNKLYNSSALTAFKSLNEILK